MSNVFLILARVTRSCLSPRKLPRRLFFIGLLAATGYLVYDRIGRRAWMQYELIAADRELVRLTDPADSLIYDGDEANSAAWQKQDGWQTVGDRFVSFDPGEVPKAAIRSGFPHAVDRLNAAFDPIRKFDELREMPKPNGGLFGGGGGLLGNANATPSGVLTTREYSSSGPIEVFCRRLQPTAGQARAITVRLLHCNADKCVFFQYEVRSPLAWRDNAVTVLTTETATIPGPAGQTRELVLLPDDPKKGVRVYAVQPDPADASRFFFDYEVNGQRGTIEGRLQADDTVKWAALSGPAADPNWNADKLQPAR